RVHEHVGGLGVQKAGVEPVEGPRARQRSARGHALRTKQGSFPPGSRMLDPHMTGDWSIDAKLLDAWRAGDQAAGSQLFDRHADAVARFFGNKVTTGAEDLVQQTFLVLIENRERIREGLTFRAFVLGVARNVLRDHLRKLAREREVDPEVEAMTDRAPGVSTI